MSSWLRPFGSWFLDAAAKVFKRGTPASTARLSSLADFFLEIARMELKQLNECPGPISVGSDGYSPHFRHAIVASVFSAFAVEHAISELIWVRCFFQTPDPYRRVALQSASGLRTAHAKREFLRATTNLSAEILDDLKKLFKYRNRVAHASVEHFEGGVLDIEEVQELIQQGRSAELDDAIDLALRDKTDELRALADEWGTEHRSLQFPSIGSLDLEAAGENVQIAEKAVKALRLEMDSDDWPVARD